jgi:hypothetical protein
MRRNNQRMINVKIKEWKKVTNGMRQATVKSKGIIEPTYEGLITKAERTFRSRSLVSPRSPRTSYSSH